MTKEPEENGSTGGNGPHVHLSRTFGALADETRRGILEQLARGEATVGELAEPFNMSRPAVSKHLRVLEDAGLIVRTRDGRVNRCRLTALPMRHAADWVDAYRRFWEAQLDSLAFFFDQRAGSGENETDQNGDENAQ